MTYEEMKQKVYELQLWDLAYGLRVEEHQNPQRFEAAGLGIVDLSQPSCGGEPGLYEIYSGRWYSFNKRTIKIISFADCNVFEHYFAMVKDIEKALIQNNQKTAP